MACVASSAAATVDTTITASATHRLPSLLPNSFINDVSRATNVEYVVTTPKCNKIVVTLPRCRTSSYEEFVNELITQSAKRDCTGGTLTEDIKRDTVMVVHCGKILTPASYHNLNSQSLIYLSLHLRLLGGMTDRQNRVGSKFGGGGMASSSSAERDRKERLRELALESVDLAKDPYLMRNHLGTYECKLCLTLHTNEGNYLAHTQGKKHQAGLAKRAAMEKKLAPTLPAANLIASKKRAALQQQTRVRIGRPGYEISKSRDPSTNQRCLSFTLYYPEANEEDGISVQPRHRFMSAYEQRVEVPDRRYQYLLVACEPYETVAFKVANEPIDRGEGRFVTNWDGDAKRFTLTFYFVEPSEAATAKSSAG